MNENCLSCVSLCHLNASPPRTPANASNAGAHAFRRPVDRVVATTVPCLTRHGPLFFPTGHAIAALTGKAWSSRFSRQFRKAAAIVARTGGTFEPCRQFRAAHARTGLGVARDCAADAGVQFRMEAS